MMCGGAPVAITVFIIACIPLCLLAGVAGMWFGRFLIVRNPRQAGLRKA